MSESGGAGRREVAYRLFAAEYDDATLEYSEEDEERAPNYVVTPTGARANRLFVVGVLTEVERVSDDVLRGRIVDPTGAFVVYAGQYQPDPKTFLERAEPPAFVAITGKARTFTPDGSDRVLTSVRPESINEVDADTRDRWVVGAATHTVERVAAFADALDRPERGDELREALLAEGVDEGLAEGIPLAIDHYGTTEAYLAAIRDLAIQASEVVAGERDEVDSLDLAPDEGGSADVDLTAAETGTVAAAASGETDTGSTSAERTDDDGQSAATDDTEAPATSDAGGATTGDTEADATATDGDAGTTAEPVAVESTDGDLETASTDEEPADEADAATDELYELDEDERERVTEEYGTEFTTGSEVDEPGEADIETPGPDEPAGEAEAVDDVATDADETAAETEPTVEADEGTASDADVGTPGAEPQDDEPVDAEAGPADDEAEDADVEPGSVDAEDVDLEEAAVEAMAELDEGDGAERDAVVDAVVEAYDADPDAVDDAIQDALMSGLCYEPGEDRLKAI